MDRFHVWLVGDAFDQSSARKIAGIGSARPIRAIGLDGLSNGADQRDKQRCGSQGCSPPTITCDVEATWALPTSGGQSRPLLTLVTAEPGKDLIVEDVFGVVLSV